MGHVRKVKKQWDEMAEIWLEASEKGYDVWRDYLNTPAFLKMLPNTTGLDGLDIAFGDAHNTRLIAKRCKSLTAIDISEQFLSRVQKCKNPSNITFHLANAAKMPFQDQCFDFVVSTMAFMDIPNIQEVFDEIFRVLKPNGFLQFSITHPCFNTHKGEWKRDEKGNIIGLLVKDYFTETNGEVQEWKHYYSPTDSKPFKVLRFEKPMHKWFNLLNDAGFTVEKVLEPTVDDEHIKKYPKLATAKVIAHSLIIRARRFEKVQRLQEIIRKLPGNLWWKNAKLKYGGCNDRVLEILGLHSLNEFVGKNDYDLWDKDIAAKLEQADLHVLKTGETITLEEVIAEKSGNRQVMLTKKSPLYDEKGKVVGIVGTSIDITDRKRAESLRVENELQKNILKEQEKFYKLANQVAHDIRSPLASLLMVIKSCHDIPEQERIALREAATSIGDIANNLLSRYVKNESEESHINVKSSEPILVSLVLLNLLADKKYQYCNSPIKFNYVFNQEACFAFVKTELTAFKCMISNLINNAADACVGKNGIITIKLEATDKQVKIIIADNGQGMSQETANKIINNIAVTSGKKEGHGIGFAQVREALENAHGTFTLNSEIGKGTTVTLTFPTTKTAAWMAHEIILNKGDTVVILDDDNSIHGAWQTRFKPYAKDIRLEHFTSGNETINFINNFPEPNKIFLLADFELLNQELTGLDVIEQTNIRRAVLVTSHFSNQNVRGLAAKTATRLLPKLLASEIPIIIENNSQAQPAEQNQSKIDLVFIDDNELFADSVAQLHRPKIVDTYSSPYSFLESLSKYPKDTKICIDNNLNCAMTGIDLAKRLHQDGFTQLFLVSGEDAASIQSPDYLTLISKTDIETIKNL
ncbi:MAG: methyltransferase domain-containing protein [Gammaproteobacteria bacterium]|nr:methyltransferase domain-containing protein [Gammaproteobacteria bacterium]